MSISIALNGKPFELNQNNLNRLVYIHFYTLLIEIDWASEEPVMVERVQGLRDLTYHNSVLRELYLCSKAVAMGVKTKSEFDTLHVKLFNNIPYTES